MCNFSVSVREWNAGIVFLHKLSEGGASRSYGIQVAGLAGVPGPVIRRAEAILRKIEQRGRPSGTERGAGKAEGPGRSGPRQLSLLPPRRSALEEALDRVDPDALTPREALETLYRLKGLVGVEE